MKFNTEINRGSFGRHETFTARYGWLKKGFEVIGVSPDSVKSHKKFADKHELPFTLLADEEKQVVEAYGVWKEKKFMGKIGAKEYKEGEVKN